MKRILFFIAIATLTLTSCQNPSTDSSTVAPTTTTTDSTPIPISDVPQSAKDYVTTHYSGYTITEVQKEVSYWATVYKVAIRIGESGKTKITLLFDVNWKFTGEKN